MIRVASAATHSEAQSRILNSEFLILNSLGAFPLDGAVLADSVLTELVAQPDALDRRIGGGERQRDERADDAREFSADGEREDHGDVRELKPVAVHVRRDQIVLDAVICDIEERNEQYR